jgi:hypothetical protein
MKNARPIRYLQPMTMAEILRPDPNREKEETKAASRTTKWFKRFSMWLAVAASCAVSGMSLGAIVGPPVFKQFGLSVADNQFDDVGQASDPHVAAVGKAPIKAEESVPAGSQSPSGSSESSKSAGRASPAPSSNSSGRSSSSKSSGGASSSKSSGEASDTPEPSSLVLLIIGGLTLSGLAIRTRRRSRH